MANPDILITPGQGTIGFSGTNTGTIQLRVAESGDVHFEGDQGSLLALTDDLSDSLFSVNDAAGMPVFEVFADDTIKAYRNNETKLEIDPDNNRIRLRDDAYVSGNLYVSGAIVTSDGVSPDHLSGLSGYFGKVGIGTANIDGQERARILGGFKVENNTEWNSKDFLATFYGGEGQNEYGNVVDIYAGNNFKNDHALRVRNNDGITGLAVMSDGLVGIGMTTKPNQGAALTVGGDVSISGSLSLDGDSDSGFTQGLIIKRHGSSHYGYLNMVGGALNINNTQSVTKIMSNDSTTMTVKDANVGIGTTNPDRYLHVHSGSAGTVTALGNSTAVLESSSHAALEFLSPNNKNSIIYMREVGGAYGYINYVHSTPVMNFSVGGSANMITLNAAGRVGIGEETPDAKLQVNGTASITGELRVDDNITLKDDQYVQWGGTNSRIAGSEAGDYLVFLTENSAKMRIMSDGKVGMGTNTPQARLQVNGDASITGEFRVKGVVAGRTVTNQDVLIGDSISMSSYNNSTKVVVGQSDAPSEIIMGQSATRNMVLRWNYNATAASAYLGLSTYGGSNPLVLQQYGGNVGIGTTNPGEKLHVSGNAIFSNGGASTNTTVRIGQGSIASMSFGGSKYTAEGTNKNSLLLGATNGQGGIRLTSLNSSSYEIWADSTALHFDSLNGNRDFYFNSNQTDENIVYITQGEGAVGIGVKPSALVGSRLAVSGDTSISGQFRTSDSIGIRTAPDGTITAKSKENGHNVINLIDSDGHALFNVRQATAGGGDCLIRGYSDGGLQKIQIASATVPTYFNGGNVGIGTTVPASVLHVKSSDAAVQATFTSEGTNAPSRINFASQGIGRAGIQVAGTERMQITHDGKVGIGLAALSSVTTGKLHVYQSGDSQPAFLVEGSQGSLFSVEDTLSGSLMSVNDIAGLPVFEAFDDGAIVMGQYNSGDLVVTGNKVGIGTEAPNRQLTIYHATENVLLELHSNDADVTLSLRDGDAAGSAYVGVGGRGNDLKFLAGGYMRGTIKSNGRLGIGTENPDALLQVNDDASITGALRVAGVASVGGITTPTSSSNLNVLSLASIRYSASAATTKRLDVQAGNTSNLIQSVTNPLHFYDDSAIQMVMLQGGNFGIGTTAPSSKLHVNTEISVGADDNNRAMFGYTASRFYLGTRQGGSNYLNTVSVTAGSVGIGTINPGSSTLNVSGSNATVRINCNGTELGSSNDTAMYSFGESLNSNLAGMRFRYNDRTTSGLALFALAGFGYPISITPSDGEDVFLNVMDGGGVGIGTSNATARLTVNGDAGISGELKVDENITVSANVIANNYYVNDFIYHNGDVNSYLGFFKDDHIVFRTAGTDRVLIDDAGHTSITGDLRVAEYIRHGGDSDTYIRFTSDTIEVEAGGLSFLTLDENPSSQDEFIINDGGVDMDFRVESDSNSTMLFVQGSTDRVSIGHSSPEVTFDVNGDATIRGNLYFDGVSSSYIDNSSHEVQIRGANGVSLWSYYGAGWTQRLTVTDPGDVGIGTTVPSGRLHVENNNTGIIVANDQITGNAFEVFGAQGNLLTVTDDLSDSLFSVNDAAGMPVFEVFADDTIKSYRNNESKLEIDPENNRIRLRDNAFVSGDLTVSGQILGAVNVEHLGDSDTSMVFSTNQIKITAGSTNENILTATQTTFNSDSRDVDFHVNGDNNTVLKVDAGSEFVDLATSKLKIGGSATASTYIKCTNTDGTVTFDALGWDDLPTIDSLSAI